jgi:hypothetical protein
MFVLKGAGVKRNAKVPHAKNVSIAPTIAHLLSLELGAVSGKVLRDALVE